MSQLVEFNIGRLSVSVDDPALAPYLAVVMAVIAEASSL